MTENKLILTNTEKIALSIAIDCELKRNEEKGRDKYEEQARICYNEQLENVLKKLERL